MPEDINNFDLFEHNPILKEIYCELFEQEKKIGLSDEDLKSILEFIRYLKVLNTNNNFDLKN